MFVKSDILNKVGSLNEYDLSTDTGQLPETKQSKKYKTLEVLVLGGRMVRE